MMPQGEFRPEPSVDLRPKKNIGRQGRGSERTIADTPKAIEAPTLLNLTGKEAVPDELPRKSTSVGEEDLWPLMTKIVDINERGAGNSVSKDGLWVLLADNITTYDRYVADIDSRARGNEPLKHALYRLLAEGQPREGIKTGFKFSSGEDEDEQSFPEVTKLRSTGAYDSFVKKVDAAPAATQQALYDNLIHRDPKEEPPVESNSWWRRLSQDALANFKAFRREDHRVARSQKEAVEAFKEFGWEVGAEVEYNGWQWYVVGISPNPELALRLVRRGSLKDFKEAAELSKSQAGKIPRVENQNTFITTITLEQMRNQPNLVVRVAGKQNSLAA
ncbi:MAG: hypothetical protein EXS55_04170 [Candidatus Magasanikbacteria bacterium]|nr:hypothetical protein [Candidatus Magasanikbacteria bacterium]